jgi:hypothetical protein
MHKEAKNHAQCSRLLRALKQSVQKPTQRATQRDEVAIERWKQERWAALKKAEQERRTLVFRDESGFYLLPMAVRTSAPCGQTPVLPVKLTRDHLSAIGALTQKGRLFMQTQDHAYDSQDVVGFLRLLLRRISGKLLIISDGATIHRSQVIKDASSARGSQTHPFKALTWVCARTQPTRGPLESAQTA